MTGDLWRTADLDLPAYLAALGVEARPPDRAALDELQEAHVRAFTFDNIDVLLGTHPGVGLPAVQEKFLGRGRGGYCFEHTTIFAAALDRLGYAVERRLGRVGEPFVAGRTHAVTIVTLDDRRLLADAGFGMSPLRPVPLEHGAEDEHGGWRYRVNRVGAGSGHWWELQRLRDSRWEVMHTTDDLLVFPVDMVMGHHFTSTFPGSHFRSGLMVTRFLGDRHLTVTHEHVTVRRPGEPTTQRPLAEGELSDLLDELGVPLTPDERDRLLAVVAAL